MDYLCNEFKSCAARVCIMDTLLIIILVICLAMLLFIGYNAIYGTNELLGDSRIGNILGGYSSRRKKATKIPKIKLKNLVKSPRSKSEAHAVKTLEEITGLEFPTAFPSWLVDDTDKEADKKDGTNRKKSNTVLELDGYNEKAKIALEFSGPLHTKWYPDKETYASYLKRVKRDILKMELCKKNGVSLIIIDAALPRIHMRAYLKSRLYDIGWITEKPFDYILEQKIEPYRNLELERESK